jgi:multidrug efflux pump subunit AcrB
VQADTEARLKADDIGKVYVRSKTTDQMVPPSTLVNIRDVAGTEVSTRFNRQRSAEIDGAPAGANARGGKP